MAKKAKIKKILTFVVAGVILLSTTMVALKLFIPAVFCDHEYDNGVCIECEHECDNNDFDKNGVCRDCDYECEHEFDAKGVCEVCCIEEDTAA